MTVIAVKRSKETAFSEIVTKGHSGYSEADSDIVCAAVSSACELTVDIFEQFGVDYSLDCDGDIPRVCFCISQNGANKAKKQSIERIVGGFVKFCEDLAEAYPDYVTITTEV